MISLAIIVSLVLGFILLTTAFGPIIASTIANAPQSDPSGNTQSLMTFILPALFGMIIISAFAWATGRKPPGRWSGQ